MKRAFMFCLLAVIAAALGAPAAWGQLTSIKGYVHDVDGKPIPGCRVEFVNSENGRKVELKTDKNGQYFSMGVAGGLYDMSVFREGVLIYKMTHTPIRLNGEGNVFNVDLKKIQQEHANELTPEQKRQQEEREAAMKKLKGLNDLLAQAKAAQDAGNLPQAVSIMGQATQTDPTRAVLWARLADLELLRGKKSTDPAERKAQIASSVEHFQKAISLQPQAGYYNNLGDALARSGDTEGAIKVYEQAAKLDPTGAGLYYFNEGATLTNIGKVDEANQAFDKAIQADPNRAEAYYQKGMNLMSKAVLKGNKMEAPPGTEETLKKFLSLQPTGEQAEVAKQMLSQIGSTVETSFGKVGKHKK